MKIDIIIPSVGESINEAYLAQWFKGDGGIVQKDDPLYVLETDKITLEVVAEETGRLSITVPEGETVSIGAVIGTLDLDVKADVQTKSAAVPEPVDIKEAPPAIEITEKTPKEAPVPKMGDQFNENVNEKVKLAPAAKRLIHEHQIEINRIKASGPGGLITKGDVVLFLESNMATSPKQMAETRSTLRKKMTPIRKKIAEKLLYATQHTAMLTTFNEIDMGRIMDIRNGLKQEFNNKYGVRLGFMSFFIKATIFALKLFPEINAMIDDGDIVYHNDYHIGVAIGTDRGLLVPVIQHADNLSFAGLEKAILDFVSKINANKLEITDLEGGTFSITNGGVYGSLMSTPILNYPQSAILGMHKVEKRPVVVDEQIVIRPMMYVALSYDHRIVDGKSAVSFLKTIKESIETPERLMMEV